MQTTIHKGMHPYRWVIFSLLAVAYLWAFFQRVSTGIITPYLMVDFNIDELAVGFIASACFYSYTIMQIPSGMLADRFGARRLVTLSLLCTAASSWLFTLSQSLFTAVLSRILVGFGISLILVPSLTAFSHWFDKKQNGLSCSLIMALTGGGLLIAGTPLAWGSAAFGWRTCFQVGTFFALALALAVWLLVRDTPAEKKLPPVEPVSPSTTRTQSIPFRQAFSLLLHSRNYWSIAVWCLMNGALFYSFAGLWAGPYLMDSYGMTPVEAGSIISLFAIGQVTGPLCFGILSGLLPSRTLLLSGSMLFVLADVMILWMFDGNLPFSVLVCCFIAYTFFVSGPSGLALAAVKEGFPSGMVGTASSMVYIMNMLGSLIFQPISGLLISSSQGAYSLLFILLACMSIIAFISCLFNATSNKHI